MPGCDLTRPQIALNGPGDYSGGGTFFPCLGRALRPLEDHVLAFRGDIMHGGDPVLKGVRYIIACFCYHDDNEGRVVVGAGAAIDSGDVHVPTESRRSKGKLEFINDQAFSFSFPFGREKLLIGGLVFCRRL